MGSLLDLLETSGPGPHVAALELVGARPQEGRSSIFRFGYSTGAVNMALVGHGWDVHRPTPLSWKKHFQLTNSKLTPAEKKDQSRLLAMKRFPGQAHLFKRKKDDGRAEAALLSLFVWEKILNQTLPAAA